MTRVMCDYKITDEITSEQKKKKRKTGITLKTMTNDGNSSLLEVIARDRLNEFQNT